jgi:hypothetical protein
MPNILHRLTIDAPSEHVHELVATREGIERWWAGKPVSGDDSAAGRGLRGPPTASTLTRAARSAAGLKSHKQLQPTTAMR